MIIDFHTHIFPPSFREDPGRCGAVDATFATLFSHPKPRLATAEDLIAAMDEGGIERAVVMGVGWTDLTIAREANDYIIESIARFPNRLIGFCSVNPGWRDDALKETERCANAGIRGIGELHPDTQSLDITDRKLMAPLMDLARDRKLIILTHASEPVGHQYPGKGDTTPDKLYALIRNFPENPIICAHWGGGLPLYSLMPELEAEMENVYFDTAASSFLYDSKIFSTVVDLAGIDHILFGSDYPLISYEKSFEHLRDSSLSREHKEDIVGNNARRLLGM